MAGSDTSLFHLGAGEGGLTAFCERYADSFHRWWADLGDVQLDPSTVARLVAGVDDESGSRSREELCRQRDALIVALRRAAAPLRGG